MMVSAENNPHQKYFDLGYFKMKLSNWNDYYSKSYFIVYTTHKGLKWLFRRYGKPKEESDKINCNCLYGS